MKIGLTSGVFDLFHVGHLRLLKKCRQQCDFLIVCVLSDSGCIELKNKKPIINEQERKELLEGLTCVDQVIIEKVPHHLYEITRQYNVNVVFKGSDAKFNDEFNNVYIPEFKRQNIEMVYFDYTTGISTTDIKNRIKGSQNDSFNHNPGT